MTDVGSNGDAFAMSQTDQRTINPLRDWVWLVAALLVFFVMQLPLVGYVVDDTFIHLTFARNLATGHGFSFNPDQPTYGITAPLWTLILAFLSLFFTPSGALATSASIIFGAATIPFFRLLADRCGLSTTSARWATIVWAGNVWLARWSASGMETALAVVLLLITIHAHISGREWRTGVLAGLAFLCRPETAGLGVILIADRWWGEGSKGAFKTALGWMLTAAPWLIYAYLAFGTIVSNPARIKTDLGLPNITDLLLGIKRTVAVIGGSNGIEIGLIIIGLFILRKYQGFNSRNGRIGLLLAIWALFPTMVYLSRGVFITSRYLLIGLPPLIIGAFLMLEEISEPRWRKEIPRLIAPLGVILILQQFAMTAIVTIPHIRAFRPTIEALTKLAEIVREKTPEKAVIAVGDVGIMGFYSGRRVMDVEGLVSAEVIPYRIGMSLENFILSARFLKAGKADYIIDKSREPRRLEGGKLGGEVLEILPVPGGLVETAKEDWYYTLYRLSKTTENEL